MRERFREGCADRAQTITDSDVDAELNRAWRYTLPDSVNGTLRQGMISFPTIVGRQNYDLDLAADVGSGNAGVIRDVGIGIRFADLTMRLDYYTDFSLFWDRYKFTDTSVGRPSAVLVRERVLTLRPIPDVTTYTLLVPGSVYNPMLTTEGIANETISMAVVRLAVRDYAGEQKWTDTLETFDLLVDESLDLVRGLSYSRPASKRRRRSMI